MTPPRTTAAEEWRTHLESWAIPTRILDQAPSFPYELAPAMFKPGSGPRTRSGELAFEALPPNGSVIDVGCGGGAATVPLVERLARATGVDESADMLDAFAAELTTHGIDTSIVEGRWPNVASTAGSADVVVCHHVAYNVADLAAFVLALDAAGDRRVVVELTNRHPRSRLAPLWKRFWDLDRPSEPTAELALAVVHEAGITSASLEPTEGSRRAPVDAGAHAVSVTRALCLGPDRIDEVATALESLPADDGVRSVIWW